MNLSCEKDKISIKSAFYSFSNRTGDCEVDHMDLFNKITQDLEAFCRGKSYCSLPAFIQNSNNYEDDQCVLFMVKWICEPLSFGNFFFLIKLYLVKLALKN